MSNEKCSETTVNVELVNVPPHRAESEKQQQKTAEIPTVPVTADLPLLPEFRAREQAINWRAALASVGLAGFLAVIAGVGCGTGTNNMLKPSPATPAVLDKALWVANGTNVVEFIPSQLASGTTDPTPHLSITSSVFGAPQGVTFDANGNLWVIDGGTVAAGGKVPAQLLEFAATQLSQLETNNAPMPNVTIQSKSFTFPQQAVFDINGDLWVSDDNLGDLAAVSSAAPFGIAGFQKAQLIPTKTGPNPNPFLVGATTTLNAPAGCNFGPVVN